MNTLKFFTISEWKKEEEYLTKQHKMGYKFSHVSFPGIYHFEKCEPEDVIYQLDYNPEAKNNKEQYIKMFNDCGFEYIQDYAGYSYFRKTASPNEDANKIYSDDSSKLDMIKRTFISKLCPLLIILSAIIIPQTINWTSRFNEDLLCKFFCIFFISFLIIYISIFIHFAIQYFKIKNKINTKL